MPEPDRRTGDHDDIGISERTKVDLKTLVLVVSGALAVAGSMTRAEMAMRSMDADLNAKIVAARYDAEKESGTMNNRLANLERTTCAIARKVAADVGACP